MLKRSTLAIALLVVVSAPAYAQSGQVTEEDLAAAAEARKAASLRLADATAEYDEAIEALLHIEDDLARIGSALALRERELTVIRAEARQTARSMYMSSGVGNLSLFSASSISEFRLGEGYLTLASLEDRATLNRLQVVKDSYLDQQRVLDEALAEQALLTAQLERVAGVMLAELEAADAEYRGVAAQWAKQEEERRRREEERRRREEEARRRAATSTTTTTVDPSNPALPTTTTLAPPTTTTLAPPPPVDGQTCPVNGATTFRDTWGAPRSGGRTHKGVDMIAAKGTPLVAIENGRVTRIGNGGLGGKTVWLRSDTGHSYYYAHLDGWAAGLREGDSLAVGELLGYVGNTGNAVYTLPHLHFEYHPNGGGPINPYPLVADLCL